MKCLVNYSTIFGDCLTDQFFWVYCRFGRVFESKLLGLLLELDILQAAIHTTSVVTDH